MLLKNELSVTRYLAPAKFSTVGEVQPTDGNHLSSREERHPSVVDLSSGKHLLFARFGSCPFPVQVSESHFSDTEDSLLTL